MLKYAKNLTLDVVGVHFHIGSNVTNAQAYRRAINDSRQVFDIGDRLGLRMTMLDIGGGFPGEVRLDELFCQDAIEISKDLDRFFPPSDTRYRDMKILSEPGRYYSASMFTLATRILGKRVESNTERWLYLNDGLSQSFNAKVVSID